MLNTDLCLAFSDNRDGGNNGGNPPPRNGDNPPPRNENGNGNPPPPRDGNRGRGGRGGRGRLLQIQNNNDDFTTSMNLNARTSDCCAWVNTRSVNRNMDFEITR